MKSFNTIGWVNVKKGFIGLSMTTLTILTGAIIATSVVVHQVYFSESISEENNTLLLKTASSISYDELIFSSAISNIKAPEKEKKLIASTSSYLSDKSIGNQVLPSHEEKTSKSKRRKVKTVNKGTSSQSHFTVEDYNYFEKYGLERIIDNAYYEGGNEMLKLFIDKHLNYPRKSKRNRDEGTVLILFDVNVLGEVENIRLKESVSEELDKEAVRLVSSFKKWKAKQINYIRVKSTLQIPITFELK